MGAPHTSPWASPHPGPGPSLGRPPNSHSLGQDWPTHTCRAIPRLLSPCAQVPSLALCLGAPQEASHKRSPIFHESTRKSSKSMAAGGTALTGKKLA